MSTIQDLKDYATKAIEKQVLSFVHTSILGTVEQKLRSYGIVIPEGADEATLGALYDIAVSASHQSDPKSAILNAAATQGISLISRAVLGDDDHDGLTNILDSDSTAGSILTAVKHAVAGKLHNIAHITAPVTPEQGGLPPSNVSSVVNKLPGASVSPTSVSPTSVGSTNAINSIVGALDGLIEGIQSHPTPPAEEAPAKATKATRKRNTSGTYTPANIRTTSPR